MLQGTVRKTECVLDLENVEVRYFLPSSANHHTDLSLHITPDFIVSDVRSKGGVSLSLTQGSVSVLNSKT